MNPWLDKSFGSQGVILDPFQPKRRLDTKIHQGTFYWPGAKATLKQKQKVDNDVMKKTKTEKAETSGDDIWSASDFQGWTSRRLSNNLKNSDETFFRSPLKNVSRPISEQFRSDLNSVETSFLNQLFEGSDGSASKSWKAFQTSQTLAATSLQKSNYPNFFLI